MTETTVGQTRNPKQKISSMGKLSRKYHRPKGRVYRCLGWDDENNCPLMEEIDPKGEGAIRKNSGVNLFSAVPEKLTKKKAKK